MVTEGKVTRKAHSKSRSRSGLKSNHTSLAERELKHKPINKEGDKYEYYTTEDEFGLPVNKLRKKGSKSKPSKNKGKS